MPSLAMLNGQLDACTGHMAELERNIEDLSEFRHEVSMSSGYFQDQLFDRICVVQRAAEVPGVRIGQKYAERMGNHLRCEMGRRVSMVFDDIECRVRSMQYRLEDELEQERLRASWLRDEIRAERVRERAEQARLEAEEQARRRAML